MSKRLLLLTIALLGACSGEVTGTPPPTPILVNVTLPEELEPAAEALRICDQSEPEIALRVDLFPSPEIPSGDLTLWLGTPPEPFTRQESGSFAALLGWEEIVAVVHGDNPLTTLSREAIAQLFEGKVNNWQELGGEDLEVSVWVFPEGNPAREAFDGAFLGGKDPTPSAWLAFTPQGMVNAIASDPGAIGYLPRAWIEYTQAEVAVVQVNPRPETLFLPVVALMMDASDENLRRIIRCLQNGEGKHALAEWYSP